MQVEKDGVDYLQILRCTASSCTALCTGEEDEYFTTGSVGDFEEALPIEMEPVPGHEAGWGHFLQIIVTGNADRR